MLYAQLRYEVRYLRTIKQHTFISSAIRDARGDLAANRMVGSVLNANNEAQIPLHMSSNIL